MSVPLAGLGRGLRRIVAVHHIERRVDIFGQHADAEIAVALRIDQRGLEQRLDLVSKSDHAAEFSVPPEDRAVEQDRVVVRRLHQSQGRCARNLARVARLLDRGEPIRKSAGIDAENLAVAIRRDIDNRINRSADELRDDIGAARSGETRTGDARFRQRAQHLVGARGFDFRQPADGRDFRRQHDRLIAVISEWPRRRKRWRNEQSRDRRGELFARIQMILDAAEMHIDGLRDAQIFDRFILERFAPGRENRQQASAQCQQHEDRGRGA